MNIIIQAGEAFCFSRCCYLLLGGLFRCFRQDYLFLQNKGRPGGDIELDVMLAVEDLGGVGLLFHISKAAVLLVVGRQDHSIFAGLVNRDQYIFQTVGAVEVEDKQQIVPVEGAGLLGRFHQQQISHPLIEYVVFFGDRYHIPVKFIEPLVLQISVIL